MRRQISSSLTWFYKWVMPVAAIGSCFAVILGSARAPGRASHVSVEVVVFVALSATFICWQCMRLKRVLLDNSHLVISNFMQEIRIPLLEIQGISENRIVNIHPITITLASDTQFGRKIVFMPPWVPFLFWTEHPVKKELREVVDSARACANQDPAHLANVFGRDGIPPSNDS